MTQPLPRVLECELAPLCQPLRHSLEAKRADPREETRRPARHGNVRDVPQAAIEAGGFGPAIGSGLGSGFGSRRSLSSQVLGDSILIRRRRRPGSIDVGARADW